MSEQAGSSDQHAAERPTAPPPLEQYLLQPPQLPLPNPPVNEPNVAPSRTRFRPIAPAPPTPPMPSPSPSPNEVLAGAEIDRNANTQHMNTQISDLKEWQRQARRSRRR